MNTPIRGPGPRLGVTEVFPKEVTPELGCEGGGEGLEHFRLCH